MTPAAASASTGRRGAVGFGEAGRPARRRRGAAALAALAALVTVAACTDVGSPTVAAGDGPARSTATEAESATEVAPPATDTTASPTSAEGEGAAPPAEPPTTVPAAPTTASPPVRALTEQAYVHYAVVGPVWLQHPAAVVERVAFHESNHDGAQRQEALATTVTPTVLESRDRGNDPQSAADIVVDPAAEIRAPVTGTVRRGGSYTLYCDHTDEYVVIEPDDRPGWEVKVLHMVGLRVARGDRVVAGETVLADHARVLPFLSQVDEIAGPLGPWPHVHVEVVDPTIPDRPGEPC